MLFAPSFTTDFSVSTQGPQVVGVSPRDGLQQVPINAIVTVQFSEPVNGESLGQVTLSADGVTVSTQSSLSNGNQMLTLVPAAALAASTPYTLTVTGVTDLAGNPMQKSFTSSFTTGPGADFTQPSVTGFDPANGATPGTDQCGAAGGLQSAGDV